MNKILFALALFSQIASATEWAEKAYIALEGEGKIAVFDTQNLKVIKQIDLSQTIEGRQTVYASHNVQVAPDGKTVWVTANVHGEHGHHEPAQPISDQVIVINPMTDEIFKRIDIAKSAHLSHVVISPDGKNAYVNAQQLNRIYKIDAHDFSILGFTNVNNQAPHGIRLSVLGDRAYIAMMQGKSIGIMDTASQGMRYVPVGGVAVQTGVTADGKFTVASLYDTKKLAVYEIASGKINLIDLPTEAKGPLQVYPTPDSRSVYLADQGYYFEQPIGDEVFKIDLNQLKVIKTIKAGQAPHGIVVSQDGKRVYVTNLLSGDLSVIDTQTDQEIARIPVGSEPNGISLWRVKPD